MASAAGRGHHSPRSLAIWGVFALALVSMIAPSGSWHLTQKADVQAFVELLAVNVAVAKPLKAQLVWGATPLEVRKSATIAFEDPPRERARGSQEKRLLIQPVRSSVTTQLNGIAYAVAALATPVGRGWRHRFGLGAALVAAACIGAAVGAVGHAFWTTRSKPQTDRGSQAMEPDRVIPGAEITAEDVEHRVKNTYQMVSSLISIHIRNTRRGDAREALRRLQERVLGLARITNATHGAKMGDTMDVAPVLVALTNHLGKGSDGSPAVQFEVDATTFNLSGDEGTTFLLATQEMLMDAVAQVRSADHPPITVTLRTSPANSEARLVVETQMGQQDDNTDIRDMGRRFIETFAQQLRAEVDFRYEDGRSRTELRYSALR